MAVGNRSNMDTPRGRGKWDMTNAQAYRRGYGLGRIQVTGGSGQHVEGSIALAKIAIDCYRAELRLPVRAIFNSGVIDGLDHARTERLEALGR